MMQCVAFVHPSLLNIGLCQLGDFSRIASLDHGQVLDKGSGAARLGPILFLADIDTHLLLPNVLVSLVELLR